jgi:aminopeptidase N
MNYRLFPFLFLLLFSKGSYSQDKTVTYYHDPASVPPDLVVSLRHMTAEVSFRPEENTVIGHTEFTFIPNRYTTDSIVFYTPDFTIRSVSVEGRETKWKLQDKSLVIYPPPSLLEYGKESSLKIDYEARPLNGLIYFIGWRPEEAGKRKEIWAHRPHGWLPYMDGRITVDMYVRFDSAYKVFSNGEKMEVADNGDGTKRWHYRMAKDHPFFSTALVIGDYDYMESRSKGGVPMEFWYYRGQENKVKTTYQYSEDMMDFLEKELGAKYPYPVYRQAPVIDYMYGAMETTTSTIFGDFMLIDRGAFWQRNYINTNAHELTHQWFGNCISHLVNADVWLTESFATYYAKMFEKAEFGEDHYENIKNDEYQLVMNAAKNNNYPVGSSMGGVARIYQKGSLVMGMLRYVMGDREFRDAVTYYFDHHAFSNVETNDFIRSVYEAGHKPYDWFFNEWILHGGEPEYRVSYAVNDDISGNRSTLFTVTQVQETNDLVGLFRMPIVFEVHYTDGTSDRVKEWIENKVHEVNVPNPGEKTIDFTLFDPGREVLKKVDFTRSFDELAAQALRAENMIDRYDALVALRDYPIERKRDLLLDCFSREHFHLTKAEIVSQLSEDRSPAAIALFRTALSDSDATVRKAVLKNITPVPDALRTTFEKALNDTSYLNVELALDNLGRSFPGQVSRFLRLTGSQEGWRGKNIRMKWLELALLHGQKKYYHELTVYTGPEYEFETRMNALSVAKRLNYCTGEIIRNAVSAYLHWNPKLSAVGKEVLVYFAGQDAWRTMILDYIHGRSWTSDEQSRLDALRDNLN